MKKLSGKTALITGGSSGIGLATARLFQEHGARLMITGRDRARLNQARDALGQDILALQSDAGKFADIEALIDRAKECFGRLDVLFLNAGSASVAPLERVSETDFDETISINLKGVFFTIQKAMSLLNDGASVIVTTSISNRLGSPNAAVYAAAKAGVRSLVQSFALELIGRKIRVNAICAGAVDTPMLGRLGLAPEAEQAQRAIMRERSPSKRMGLPNEIAQTALFLACDDSSYIVGQEIVIDGGRTLT
jgi:NAD(P)-dependent dehydrogenase (short-subunit alcohol dehydrogenase family)